MERVYIVGAGPAGAAAAHYLSGKGLNVIVYDNSPYPGFKPCGWAVPRILEEIIDVEAFILNTIRGFRVYVDGELAHEYHGEIMGYIIDKPKMLRNLLEGSTIVKKTVRLESFKLEYCRNTYCIIATGSITPQQDHDFINVVHADIHAENARDIIEDDVIELWFDGNLVGYYWVFPRGERRISVGVGGYESFAALKNRLHQFLKARLEKSSIVEIRFEGARINVIGRINVEKLMLNPHVVGEAAGFVYPLTGEGIRPAILSGYAVAKHIVNGDDPLQTISSTIKWIERQRKLLDKVMKASPKTRSELMKHIPTKLLPLIGMGTASTSELLRLAAKAPLRIAKILKTILLH